MAAAKPTKAKAEPTKKVPSKSTTVKKAAAPKKAPAKKAAKARSISAEERYKMIEVAAYYIAERHSFRGNTLDFWVTAEAEISKKIGK